MGFYIRIYKIMRSILRSPTMDGGRLDKGTQEFLMGHILPGSQDHYYDRNDVDFHRTEHLKLDFGRPSRTKLSDRIMTTMRRATDISEDPDVILQQFIETRHNGIFSWQQLSEDRKVAVLNEALE